MSTYLDHIVETGHEAPALCLCPLCKAQKGPEQFKDVRGREAEFAAPFVCDGCFLSQEAANWMAAEAAIDDDNWESERGRTMRYERTLKLAATDGLVAVDRPISEPLRAYRQALRDLTTTFALPSQVVWPEYPGATK